MKNNVLCVACFAVGAMATAATSAVLPGETVLWPSETTELRAQPDSTLASLPDGAGEVRTGVEASFPGVRLDKCRRDHMRSLNIGERI